MSRAVVNPARRSFCAFCTAMSSEPSAVPLGGRGLNMCVCASMRPGRTVAWLESITCTPAGDLDLRFRTDIGDPLTGEEHNLLRQHLAGLAVEEPAGADGKHPGRKRALEEAAFGSEAHQERPGPPPRRGWGRQLRQGRPSTRQESEHRQHAMTSHHTPSRFNRDEPLNAAILHRQEIMSIRQFAIRRVDRGTCALKSSAGLQACREKDMRFIITARAGGPGNLAPADGPFDEKLFSDYMKFNEEMYRAGVLVASEGLNVAGGGARIEVRKGKRVVVDGPFAESKELVGGFYIVEVG